MGTKKMGRPTNDPKTVLKHFRMSDEDLRKLKFCAEQTGLSESEIVRKGIENVYQELKK